MTSQPNRRTPDRGLSFQDDLLADLRQAAPVPGDRTPAPRSVTARILPSFLPVPAPAPVAAGDRPSPGIELRMTRQPWSMPALRQLPGVPGLELSAGPLRLSLAFLQG